MLNHITESRSNSAFNHTKAMDNMRNHHQKWSSERAKQLSTLYHGGDDMLCSVKSPYMDRNDASDPRRPTPIRRQVEETFTRSDEGVTKDMTGLKR